jgi:LytS/YehU family sensor histidine kinase
VPQISISEELVFLDQYVQLQKLRFADRLRVELDVQEDTYSALIPTLILQPLIENAVQHGVLMRESGGSVFVSIRRLGDELRVLVEDDGPGPAAAEPERFGIGLTNTAERLRTLYADGAAMSIGRAASGGFAIQLSLPFCEAS